MARKKVLLTVVTYPLPSRSYDELVCTAGVLENGDWIRIYPVPLSFLLGQKKEGSMKSYKYNWIELELQARRDDFRPESYSPVHYDFRDIQLLGEIDTRSNWLRRKEMVLKDVFLDMDVLIEASKAPNNKSLATFKPSSILGFDVVPDEREWKDEWKKLREQGDLFSQDKPPEKLIPKLPYKFYYRFEDEKGRISRLMIEDWEIGQLYWNCLRRNNGDEGKALEQVRYRYENEFLESKDLYFFLGTTKQWHLRRSTNPFVIIGVFYPKKKVQLELF